jgi:hypothetical protein
MRSLGVQEPLYDGDTVARAGTHSNGGGFEKVRFGWLHGKQVSR